MPLNHQPKKHKFAKLYPGVWHDPKVAVLDIFEKIFFMFGFSNLFSIKGITGIYEIGIEDAKTPFNRAESIFGLEKYGIMFKKSDKKRPDLMINRIINIILNECNKKEHKIIEYDFKNHIIFVKTHFKSQYKTIGNPIVAVRMILNDFSETFLKNQKFWFQFGIENNHELLEILDKVRTNIDNTSEHLEATKKELLDFQNSTKKISQKKLHGLQAKIEDLKNQKKDYTDVANKYMALLTKLKIRFKS